MRLAGGVALAPRFLIGRSRWLRLGRRRKTPPANRRRRRWKNHEKTTPSIADFERRGVSSSAAGDVTVAVGS